MGTNRDAPCLSQFIDLTLDLPRVKFKAVNCVTESKDLSDEGDAERIAKKINGKVEWKSGD